jgi:multiple sugar transport system ATP-binding protein
MASVSLSNVCKIFPGGVKVVSDFSLDIADHEFVVFVGPSGCGKSTTLRLIAGLEEITSGTIRIGDRVVNDVAPKDRDIAMVFQNYALYPHMTVLQNMAFGLKLRKIAKSTIEEKVKSTAKVLGISHLLGRKPSQLSGGQRQRVAVGRAIVRDPACFLFDEPLSNLDAKLRVEMRAEIKRLHMSLESTTVYVTHDQEEAMTLGDRVVVMKDGVIQQCGAPLEIYHRPINRFVAGFLGTPSMNFLEGTIVADAGALFFDEGSGKIRVPAWAGAALQGKVGSKVVLGVRPQAISHKPPPGEQGGTFLEVKVDVVEPLGDKMDVHLSTEKHPHIVAHIDAQTDLAPAEVRKVYLDLTRVHFFEPGEMGAKLATAPMAS